MKKIYFAILLPVILLVTGYNSVYATSVVVSDTIHSDSVWQKPDVDTVKVIGDLAVADGVTLTIGPGVIIEFQGYFLFSIKGTLLASGTAQDSIKFTMNPDSLSIGWQGLEFKLINAVNDTSRLEYSVVEYSKHGGIYNLSSGKLIIDHCLIRNNSFSIGADWGAGLCIVNSNPVITNNTIAYNTQVSGKGGGIFFSGSNINRFSGNLICNNQAYTGGAINLNYSDITSVNNIFVNNTASNIAGGVFILQSTPTFINNTVANNKADRGGGIAFSLNSNAVLKNVLVDGNTAITSGNNVFFYAAPVSQSFTYCDIEGDSTSFAYNGGGHFTGVYTNNLSLDPEFINPTSGAGNSVDAINADWGLLQSSPVVNKGTPDTTGLMLPAFDFYGNIRIYDDTVDIGATEFSCGNFSVDLGEDSILCGDQSLTFDVGTAFDSLEWMSGSADPVLLCDSAGTGLGTLEVYVTVYSGTCSASDTVLVTFDVCVDITNHPPVSEHGFIYDQTNEVLVIEGGLTKGNWSIYSIDGRLMKASSEFSVISLADFSPGIYIVRCEIEGSVVIRKISVQ
jgi:hypothetical protein